MIKLNIDGKQVDARKGETVLETAQRHGIYIPTLCYHKDLSTYGGCRLCLVEVKGWLKPTASCTLPVQEGMEIITESPQLKRLRRFSLQLILSEHPHACLICDKTKDCAQYQECIQKAPVTFGCKFCAQNGNCELQKLVEYLEIKEIPFPFSYRNKEVERYDPFFDRDYNLCILCGRCVRVCQEVRRAGVLDFHHRGPKTLVGTAYDLPHLETGCQFCGACIDVCPTGALRDRFGKWFGIPDKKVKTTCMLCNLGCSVQVNIRNDTVVNTTPDNGDLCVRGRFGIAPLVNHRKRVTVPLMRRNGRMVQVGWKEALEFASSRLSAHKGKTGIIFSTQMTSEALDVLANLARHVQCTAFSTSVRIPGADQVFDFKGITKKAAFIIVNTDLISDFSPLLMRLRQRLNDPRFIVIDAIRSQFAQNADLWLRPIAGQEQEVIDDLTSKNSNGIAGIPKADMLRALELLAGKDPYLVYNTMSVTGVHSGKGMKVIPLNSSVNAATITRMGITATMSDVLDDSTLTCLYCIGAGPRPGRQYATVIAQDCFLPAFDCDLILPSATFVETGGTVVALDGKKKRVRKAVTPAGKSRSDEWIFSEISEMLGISNKNGLVRNVPQQVPATARFKGTDVHFPLQLIVRNNCYVYRGALLSQLLTGFRRLRNDQSAWINPATAKEYGLTDGAQVVITGKTITLHMAVYVTTRVPEKTLLIHTYSSMGELVSQPVKLEPVGAKREPGKER
ncbi:(2Fe-2S)-binding protein [candidate division WOR-3 bacterium]|nr:(2Fe-2S)-binding protein [candidate division WOR-3 bacterium]